MKQRVMAIIGAAALVGIIAGGMLLWGRGGDTGAAPTATSTIVLFPTDTPTRAPEFFATDRLAERSR